jgi:uncharacterized glyoxalase superfamily protein PhnB
MTPRNTRNTTTDPTTDATTDPTTDPASTPRPDANIWPGFTYDDPRAVRHWLASLGFQEGILVGDDEGAVHHSEMWWPEGGRVMLSSRGAKKDRTFEVARGACGCYVVTTEPDVVHERALRLGAEVVRDLQDTDYGSRGFTVRDPEGNLWSFGTYAGDA